MTSITGLAAQLHTSPADVAALVDQLIDIDGREAVIASEDTEPSLIDTPAGTISNYELTNDAVEAIIAQIEAQS